MSMKFERKDGRLIDPIEAGIIEVHLLREFKLPIDISETGHYFDLDVQKYGLSKSEILPVLDKLGYKPLVKKP